MTAPTSYSWLRAFKRNCKGVRMNDEEEDELARLFFECEMAARRAGHKAAQENKQP